MTAIWPRDTCAWRRVCGWRERPPRRASHGRAASLRSTGWPWMSISPATACAWSDQSRVTGHGAPSHARHGSLRKSSLADHSLSGGHSLAAEPFVIQLLIRSVFAQRQQGSIQPLPVGAVRATDDPVVLFAENRADHLD